jgi:multidrug efflux pump subunit AcrA (membrane-fusion protein)
VKRLAKWLLVPALIAASVFATWRLAQPEPPSVTLRKVERTRIEDTVSGIATGHVEPARRVDVQPELGGRVVEVRVKRGDTVKVGDVMVVLDDTDLQNQVRSLAAAIPVLQTRVRQASARAGQLDRERDRLARLHDAGALPGQQFDSATYGRDLAALDRTAADAALDQARVGLELARDALRKTRLVAPIDGTVLDVRVEVGDSVGGLSLGTGAAGGSGGGGGASLAAAGGGGASSALAAMASTGGGGGLVELADESAMFVYVDVDEADLWKVKPGQRAVMTVDALAKRKIEGTVEEVFPFISRSLDQNRTTRIKVRLPDEVRGQVLPGMSANVDVIVGFREGVLVVPTLCVVVRPTGRIVWKVGGDRVLETRIDIGVSTWEWTEVEAGLVEGDTVAIPPGDIRLADGMEIKAAVE